MGGTPYEERRRSPRIVLREPLGGTIFTSAEGTLVNLSTTGALLEHAHAVRIGQPYILVISVASQEVRLRCRVVRSGIHQIQSRGGAEQVLMYRTGVEFLETPAASLQILQEWIQTRPA